MFCFINEDYLYSFEEKLPNKKEPEMRLIDGVIDMRHIYRILAYVRFTILIIYFIFTRNSR